MFVYLTSDKPKPRMNVVKANITCCVNCRARTGVQVPGSSTVFFLGIIKSESGIERMIGEWGTWCSIRSLILKNRCHRVSSIFHLKLCCWDQRLCLFIRRRASYSTSPSFSVLTCKRGIIVVISQSCYED